MSGPHTSIVVVKPRCTPLETWGRMRAHGDRLVVAMQANTTGGNMARYMCVETHTNAFNFR